MPFLLVVLVVGVCFICGEANGEISSHDAPEMADVNFDLNLPQICGLKKCEEDQCCVGSFIFGYCLDSPEEGQFCAIRANKMEEFFCGKCGLKLKCINGKCRKPPGDE